MTAEEFLTLSLAITSDGGEHNPKIYDVRKLCPRCSSSSSSSSSATARVEVLLFPSPASSSHVRSPSLLLRLLGLLLSLQARHHRLA